MDYSAYHLISRRCNPNYVSYNPKDLECPFTWHFNEGVAIYFDPNKISVENEVFVPVLTIMGHVMKAFLWSMREDHNKAQIDLNKARLIKQRNQGVEKFRNDGICFDMISHIIEASQYFVSKRAGDIRRATLVHERILCASRLINNICNIATNYGCCSIAWSTLFHLGVENSIRYAREAINISPQTAFWQFILGKMLRRQRRINKCLKPSEQEVNAFQQAVSYSDNQYFIVCLAQTYREKKRFAEALNHYDRVNMDSPCIDVLLKLALGYIRLGQMEKAYTCLSNASRRDPDCPRLNHYFGLYWMKLGEYREAADYFCSSETFAAHLQYIECMMKISEDFEAIQHLENLLMTYSNDVTIKQTILIQIGLVNYYKYSNLQNAVIYFYKAIDLDPRNSQLKHSYNIVSGKPCNIFNIAAYKLIKICERQLFNATPYLSEIETAKLKFYVQTYFCMNSIYNVQNKNENVHNFNENKINSNHGQGNGQIVIDNVDDHNNDYLDVSENTSCQDDDNIQIRIGNISITNSNNFDVYETSSNQSININCTYSNDVDDSNMNNFDEKYCDTEENFNEIESCIHAVPSTSIDIGKNFNFNENASDENIDKSNQDNTHTTNDNRNDVSENTDAVTEKSESKNNKEVDTSLNSKSASDNNSNSFCRKNRRKNKNRNKKDKKNIVK